MNIQNLTIDKIKPYKNNPRKISQTAIDMVAKSIKEFGFKNPIIIDKNNVIVCGHTRLLAAQQLKLNDIPVISASDLTDKQIKAFRLIDNKTSEFSEWDNNLLVEELNFDFDFDEYGFDSIDPLDESFDKGSSAEQIIDNIYQVIVECDSERNQEKAFDLLNVNGFKCRVVSL